MGWIISFSSCRDAIEKNEREGPTKASCRLDGEIRFLDASLRCIIRTMALGQKLCGEFLCSYVARVHSEVYFLPVKGTGIPWASLFPDEK